MHRYIYCLTHARLWIVCKRTEHDPGECRVELNKTLEEIEALKVQA